MIVANTRRKGDQALKVSEMIVANTRKKGGQALNFPIFQKNIRVFYNYGLQI